MAQFEAVVWSLLVSLAAWLVISGRVPLPALGMPEGLPSPAPHPRYPAFDEYDAVSPLHRQRAADMLRRFAGVYQSSFGRCNRELVIDMHEMRSRALASLYEIRMRLPNDVKRYDALTKEIEKVERSTLNHIDDVTDRCQLGLIHTKPVHDHYYAHNYRAANDQEP
jgi:hypothetical protein